LTLVIYDLWKTNNCIWQVAAEFQLDRGFVQQIVQSAASFANCVLHFCEHLDEFWPYKNLLLEFCRRLQYNCVATELIPLLDLDNVRLARAKQLLDAGYTTLELISIAKPGDLAKKIQNMQYNAAAKIIKSARVRFCI
jgi:POLQ-like helicase